LVGVQKRNKNKVNSRKSFFLRVSGGGGAVESFSSPLIPYGIQPVKIRQLK
jgi:hypothetical protein